MLLRRLGMTILRRYESGSADKEQQGKKGQKDYRLFHFHTPYHDYIKVNVTLLQNELTMLSEGEKSRIPQGKNRQGAALR